MRASASATGASSEMVTGVGVMISEIGVSRSAGRATRARRRSPSVTIPTSCPDSLTTIAKPPEERTDPADLFVHSTIFVVVDKLGRLRGAFETQGDHVSWPEVKQRILAAVKQLEQEP